MVDCLNRLVVVVKNLVFAIHFLLKKLIKIKLAAFDGVILYLIDYE